MPQGTEPPALLIRIEGFVPRRTSGSVHGNTANKTWLELETVVAENTKWMEEGKEPIPGPFGLKKFKGYH
jgi:hypothetical protein